MRKFKKIFVRLLYLVVVIALLVTLPFLGLKNNEDLEMIYSVFLGKKSKYQGMIEIWNIDTFEGGTASKLSYLNASANMFQKQNKGLYIITRNLSEQECLNLIKQGEMPDLFSCSYGVASEIFQYIEPFSSSFNIYDNFLNAGMIDGLQYGVPWCFSNYYLITSKAHLTKAKVDVSENLKLSDIALSSGYVKKGKNEDTIIYSLGFGAKKYLLPKLAFMSYTSKELKSISDTAINFKYEKESPYSVYSKFVVGDITILLGTNRDVFRVQNRVNQGKISDCFYEPLTSTTDLIQFMFLAKTDNDVKKSYTQKFAEMVVGDGKGLFEKTGLFSATKTDYSFANNGVMQDIILDNIASYTLNNVFITKSEIEKLQSKNEI